MKKSRTLQAIFLSFILFFTAPYTVYAENEGEETEQAEEQGAQPVTISSPCAVLMEASTGQILYEKEADTERTPASVTKLMTLLLIYEQMEAGKLSLEDTVTVSAHAQSMGGSQVFLEEGETQTVETMIKCIVIASGNDASVAMAEHIGGSEENFVAMMNERAKELGMNHTNFVDCCGLTDDEAHVLSAGDIAILTREIVTRFPEIFDYSTIWMEDITHETRRGSSSFTLTNTNKMLRTYDGCVGLKTGSTSRAGYCVSEVAVRGDITMIAVILGGETSKQRFADAAALLNYGFGISQVYRDEEPLTLICPRVARAKTQGTACHVEQPFTWLDLEGRELSKITREIVFQEELTAPLTTETAVGTVDYYYEGEKIGSVRIFPDQAIELRTFGDCLHSLWGDYLLGEGSAEGGEA